MSGSRFWMLFTGAVLTILVGAVVLLRAFDVRFIQEVPATLFWLVLFILLVVAAIMLMFTPPSHSKERRVDLTPPVTQHQMARPGKSAVSRSDLPVTRTAKRPKDPKPTRHPPSGGVTASDPAKKRRQQDPRRHKEMASVDPAQQGPRRAIMPPSLSPAGPGSSANDARHEKDAATPSDNGASRADRLPPSARDPNTPAQEPDERAPPSLRPRLEPSAGQEQDYDEPRSSKATRSRTDEGSNAPPSLRRPGIVARHRAQGHEHVMPAPGDPVKASDDPRRRELESRLNALERSEDSAGTSLATGRMSHADYTRSVKKTQRERSRIEGELVEMGEH